MDKAREEQLNALFDPVRKVIQQMQLDHALLRDGLLTREELIAVLDAT